MPVTAPDINKIFSKATDSIKDHQEEIVKKTVVEFHREVMDVSPVRKGYYKANNFIEAKTPSNEPITQKEGHDTATGVIYGSEANQRVAEANMIKGSLAERYYLYNSVAYAIHIEARHSKMAPNGVYLHVASRASQIIRTIVSKNRLKFKNI